jgi:maleylpyruvate isomerase
MYASPATRAADLEAGVRRPADVVIADAAASAARFVIEARLVPTEAWNAQVAFTSGLPNPPLIAATKLLDFRLREVEFHHVDLGGPYGFASTPRSTVTLLLDDTLVRLNRADFVVRPSALDGEWIVTPGERDVVVRAGRTELLAWLSGRSASGVTPLGGELPEVPSLG